MCALRLLTVRVKQGLDFVSRVVERVHRTGILEYNRLNRTLQDSLDLHPMRRYRRVIGQPELFDERLQILIGEVLIPLSFRLDGLAERLALQKRN